MVEPSFRMRIVLVRDGWSIVSNESHLVRDPFPPMWTSTRYDVCITGRGHLSLIQIMWTKCAMSSWTLTAQIQPPNWTKCKWLSLWNVFVWNDTVIVVLIHRTKRFIRHRIVRECECALNLAKLGVVWTRLLRKRSVCDRGVHWEAISGP